jgi:hypothetical protein
MAYVISSRRVATLVRRTNPGRPQPSHRLAAAANRIPSLRRPSTRGVTKRSTSLICPGLMSWYSSTSTWSYAPVIATA